MQGTRVQPLIRENPTHLRATKTMHHNYYRAASTWGLSLQQEKPLQQAASVLQWRVSSCSPQLEKVHLQQWRPSATKNLKRISKLFLKKKEIPEPEEQPIDLKQHLSILSFRPRAKGTPAKGGWGGKELPDSTTKARSPLESTKGAY